MPVDRRPATDDFLSDAGHFPGGHAAGVVFPRSIEEIQEVLAGAEAVLPIGAQSSLTGGATPFGEVVLATSKMARVVDLASQRIVVEPGVTVAAMQAALGSVGAWFPPAPTFTGACAGGIVATNAAGAATFKYGSTRDWVEAITIVLADGTVLDLERGAYPPAGERFEVVTRRGRVSVPAPRYRMPDVPKRSAGYYAAPGMDLLDLFIGSEGTLGVIARITFRAAWPAPQTALAFVPCRSEPAGLALVAEIRAASRATWTSGAATGIDVAAIEHMDRRCLEILREDGADRRHHVRLAADAVMALLVQLELPAGFTQERAHAEIATALSQGSPGPLREFCRLLDRFGLLEEAEIALPGQARRAADFLAAREAIPAGVNARVGAAQRSIDARIRKTAADMIVPFEYFGEMLELYRAGFASRALDYAVWGHISDGNVHPNVIPRTFADVESGTAAILEFGRAVTALGGCPLAEHGVGRSPLKQALLQELYGDAGIGQMRAVKRALDPEWKLAPGVIFTRT